VPDPDEIVGRDDELAVIDGFMNDPRGVLLLDGEAGIGKTTLWSYGVTIASDRHLVLACGPSAAESELAFASAGDLLRGHAYVLDALPPPRRRALAAALLLEDPGDVPPEPRAVALAFLGALGELACDRSVIVAVDDAQWLDAPSSLLIEFALRRVHDEPIAFFVTRRSNREEPLPLGLARLRIGALHRLEIGPLSLGALQRVIRLHHGMPLRRPLLRRVAEVSGGNPLLALELTRACTVA
jgi:predicted ATPase